ncbi:MAG: hypothetical protein C0592_11135 [Marinilabiliales bacterium]|nr:MAG: hypothetical protein C0592_11135 [Marinilabiliales bacterium]
MRFLFTVVTLLVISALAHSQVINIENQRIKGDTNTWSGKIKLGATYVQTSSELLRLNWNNHIQYKKDSNLVLILTDYYLSKSASESFENAGTMHIRYNRKIKENFTLELFTQAQYNKLLNVDFRWLTGIGPRFKILHKGKSRIYFASLYMYEYEELSTPLVYHRDHRISSYLSMNLKIADNVTFVNTTYFQPKVTDFEDFRVYSQFDLQFKFSKHFAFSTAYRLYYDSKPPEGIVMRTHYLTNSLVFSFN